MSGAAQQLDELLGSTEPNASWHDAALLQLELDYVGQKAISLWDLYVGDPEANDSQQRERSRRGRLILNGLHFWVIEGPHDLNACGKRPWLVSDGPIHDSPTEEGKRLAALLPEDSVGWYLFFTRRNAFMYCGARSAQFEWQ